jgi:hypothetical protein
LLCPVSGRWLVVFWSRKPLSKAAAPAVRVAIWTHVKKAQTKLNARNRTQAVAEAIRQQLLV